MKIKYLTLIATFACFSALAIGDVIAPTGATSTSSVGSPRTIDKAIDGSGLTDVSDPSSELDDEHIYGADNLWLSASGAVSGGAEELSFDLGGAYDIDTVYYWPYTRDHLRNLLTFDISYSTDGGSTFSAPVSAASLGMANWGIQNNVRDPSVVETRTFSSTLSGVTNIRFSNLQNHGDASFFALSEIRFGGVSAGPPTGPIDAGQSSAVASPTTVPANDFTTSTITVTINNSIGLPLSGKVVSLSGDGSASIDPPTDTTDANGVATFTVKSATTGTETFTATSESVSITETASVEFTEVPTGNVITPIGATSSTDIGDGRIIGLAIDGTGLVDVSNPSSVLDDYHPYQAFSYWLSASGAVSSGTEELTFDLGGTFDVDALYYWLYTRDGDRNLRTFDISYSTDGGSSYSTPVSAASLNMADWSIGPSDRSDAFVESRTFDTLSGVTHIRFSNLQNHGDPSFFAMMEIRFGGIATGGGNTFTDWIAGFEVGGQTTFTGDFDKDGLGNGIENYFGTDPSEFTAGVLPNTVDTGAGTFTFTHPINDSPASDVNAAYRWSKNLSDFYYSGQSDTAGTTVTFTPGTPSGGMMTSTATITGTSTDKIFVDIEVTQD